MTSAVCSMVLISETAWAALSISNCFFRSSKALTCRPLVMLKCLTDSSWRSFAIFWSSSNCLARKPNCSSSSLPCSSNRSKARARSSSAHSRRVSIRSFSLPKSSSAQLLNLHPISNDAAFPLSGQLPSFPARGVAHGRVNVLHLPAEGESLLRPLEGQVLTLPSKLSLSTLEVGRQVLQALGEARHAALEIHRQILLLPAQPSHLPLVLPLNVLFGAAPLYAGYSPLLLQILVELPIAQASGSHAFQVSILTAHPLEGIGAPAQPAVVHRPGLQLELASLRPGAFPKLRLLNVEAACEVVAADLTAQLVDLLPPQLRQLLLVLELLIGAVGHACL